jgi:hypothetical protein
MTTSSSAGYLLSATRVLTDAESEALEAAHAQEQEERVAAEAAAPAAESAAEPVAEAAAAQPTSEAATDAAADADAEPAAKRAKVEE